MRTVSPTGALSTVQIGAGDGFFQNPSGVALDGSGAIYVSDSTDNTIRRAIAGAAQIVAGSGSAGFSGDTDLATNATLHLVLGVAVDALGRVIICDNLNRRIRRVDTDNIILTIAGNGGVSEASDGEPAIAATLSPFGVAVGADGTVVFSDSSGHRIRSVDDDGLVRTIAGDGLPALEGDGGSAIHFDDVVHITDRCAGLLIAVPRLP